MISYILTERGLGATKPYTVVCTRQTMRKHINFSLRLLGRNRVRGLYNIKKVWIDL